jgi:hypothetical protein
MERNHLMITQEITSGDKIRWLWSNAFGIGWMQLTGRSVGDARSDESRDQCGHEQTPSDKVAQR